MMSVLAVYSLLRRAAPVAAVVWVSLLGPSAQASCTAIAGLRQPLTNAAYEIAAVPPGHVGLSYLGHASFLIESPSGVTAVTDYNGFIKPDFIPDIVTMNDKGENRVRRGNLPDFR